MSQITLYASVLAKIGAEKSNLLSEAKLKTIVETKTLSEFSAQLRDTVYQPQLLKATLPLTSRKLERVFNESLIESYIKIINNSPKKARPFLNLVLLKFEIENIKTLIKAANANLPPEQRLSKVYVSVEDCLKKRALIEEAAKAPTIKQIVNNLKISEYGPALTKGLQSYEEKGSTAGFDILLDKFFYDSLYDAFFNLQKKEKPHAKYYASIENDSFTLLTILRGKVLNYDPNWLRLAVSRNKFNLSSDIIEALLVAPDFESTLKIAFESNYGKFFAKAPTPEEIIVNAERAFKRAEFHYAKVSTVPEIFNIGGALAFIKLKEAEVHNLIASSAGVEAGVNPEAILSQMLF